MVKCQAVLILCIMHGSLMGHSDLRPVGLWRRMLTITMVCLSPIKERIPAGLSVNCIHLAPEDVNQFTISCWNFQEFITVRHVVFPLSSPVAQISCESMDASHFRLTS